MEIYVLIKIVLIIDILSLNFNLKKSKQKNNKEDKLIKILYVLLGKKLGENKAKRILDIIIKNEDDLEMLDVIERIEENERKALEKSKNEGKIEGRKEGRKEGREEGRREGIIEKTIEIAKNMIKQGCDIDFIHTITGLKKSEIERLY